MLARTRSHGTMGAAARVASLCLLLMAACGQGDNPVVATNGDHAMNGAGDIAAAAAVPDPVAEGIRVYHAQYCGTCHANTVAGTAGSFGPSHDGLRITAEKRIHDPGYTGTAATAEEYVRESIRDPGEYRAPGFEHTRFLMPAYIQLTDAEVDALVRFLLWQPTTEGRRP